MYFKCKTDKLPKGENKFTMHSYPFVPIGVCVANLFGSFGIFLALPTINCLPTPLIRIVCQRRWGHPTHTLMSPIFYLVQICQVRFTVISQDRSNQHEINQFKQINLSGLGKFDAESGKFLPTDGLVGTIVNCQHHLDGMVDRGVHAHICIYRSRGGLELTQLDGEFAKINSTRVCECKCKTGREAAVRNQLSRQTKPYVSDAMCMY